ncbi:MAG: serine/threonine-protein kinase [Deltaproteobacteria bacterium]|nr:serine/threonine-protein kinase [Deltaproteobacteria bacterium]
MTAAQIQALAPALAAVSDAGRELESTRTVLRARLDAALSAITGVVIPTGTREVLTLASALLGDPQLSPDRALVFIEPRRLQLERELADVDAAADDAEATRLLAYAVEVETDADASVLLKSGAARLMTRARRRRTAEDGLRALDDEVVNWTRRHVGAQLALWLVDGELERFEVFAAAVQQGAVVKGVVRAARVCGAALRYLDALHQRCVGAVSAQVLGASLQLQVLEQAACDDDDDDDLAPAALVEDALARCACFSAVCSALAGFKSWDQINDDDVLWDHLLGAEPVRSLLGNDGDGAFLDEVRSARALQQEAQHAHMPTAVDVVTIVSVPAPSQVTAIVEEAPARLGRYQLLSRIGAGGMAEVWLARQDGPRGFQKTVVVKRILGDHASDPYFIGLFQKEAAVIARLQHPNIIHVFDLGVEGDRWFMAMEYLQGKSLLQLGRHFFDARLPFPVDVAARAVADAARGLAHAHKTPVVHRDISPDNLFVTSSGLTKVIDFGVARGPDEAMTSSNSLKGKVPYMAPELFRGEPFDAAIDVFALGVTLWFLLVGKRPFGGARLPDIMRSILESTPLPPSRHRSGVPPLLDEIVMSMLSPRAADRPKARAVDEALSSCACGPAVVAALPCLAFEQN